MQGIDREVRLNRLYTKIVRMIDEVHRRTPMINREIMVSTQPIVMSGVYSSRASSGLMHQIHELVEMETTCSEEKHLTYSKLLCYACLIEVGRAQEMVAKLLE